MSKSIPVPATMTERQRVLANTKMSPWQKRRVALPGIIAVRGPAKTKARSKRKPKRPRIAHVSPLDEQPKRYRVWVRCGEHCVYCGIGLLYTEVTLDHVVPKSRGGSSRLTNLVAACVQCNHAKGDLDATEFAPAVDLSRYGVRMDTR